MKNTKILLLSLLAVIFFMSSCDDDESTSVNESKLLVEHLESAVTPVVNTFPVMIKSTDINNAVITQDATMFIIDIRSAEAFATSHIDGAVNVEAGKVLEYYEANNLETYKTVAIVCYSGQTAGWVNGLLRTLGKTNTKDMKWGMASWDQSTATGSWPDKISSGTQLVTEATAKPEAGNLPVLNTGSSNAEDILRDRVEAVFTEGFGSAKVSASEVVTNPEKYHIVNYWKESHYNWNHITGAIQYSPKASLTSDTFLKTLPTDKPIVIYCYTGQTSAHVAAYLRVLGYDAKSLLYGVNGMAYNGMVTYNETAAADDKMVVFNPETDIHTYFSK